MQYDADVIITGAGPAGTMAAFELAGHDIDVLVIDKAEFPRYKVCGIGLTHKILQEIPYDVSPVIEQEIFSVRFSCNYTDVFTRTSSEPLIYCMMRDRFDQFLLQQAIVAGARVIMGEHITGIHRTPEGVEIKTRNRRFRSRFLVGADGASSVIANASGLRKDVIRGMAWEAEMEACESDIGKWSQTVFLDWGTLPGGYGWIFPKKSHFSVGVGGPASLSVHMKQYNDRFVRASGIRFTATRSVKAWPIPVKVRKGFFHANRILVAGDAAGLTDPLTGEGIYYAIRSGKMAGKAILNGLNGDPLAPERYSEEVNAELMPELIEAGRVKDIFNAVPLRIHKLVRDRERIWNAFRKILRGDKNYLDVKTGLGRWKFLWSIVCRIAKLFAGKKRFKS